MRMRMEPDRGLALTGHEAEADEALQRYLALPRTGPRTIAEWKAQGSVHQPKATRAIWTLGPDNRGPAQGGDAGGVKVWRAGGIGKRTNGSFPPNADVRAMATTGFILLPLLR